MIDLIPKTEKDADSVVPFHTDINNIPLVNNTVSLTTPASNTGTTRNEYGTYEPFRDRMIEPKQEIIEDSIPLTDTIPLSTTDTNNTDTVLTDLIPKTEEDANSAVPFRNNIDNIPLVDNTISLTIATSNTDTGGVPAEDEIQLNAARIDDTYEPYQERMVEPVDMNKTKKIITIVDDMPMDDVLIPIIDNQQSIRNENDDTIDGDIEEEDIATRKDALFTSAARRSGRITKRPRYGTDDEEHGDTIDTNKDANTAEISIDVMSVDDVVIPDIHNQQSIGNENAIDMEEQEVEDGNNSLVLSDTPALNDTNTPSASTTRKLGRIVKRPRYTTDDEESDDEEASGLNDTLLKNESKSTTRRSGRVVKMPKYVMDDEDTDEEDGKSDTTKLTKKRKKDDVSSAEGIQCQKCLKQLAGEFRMYCKAKNHAIIHTKLKRFECLVKGCGYKSGLRQNVSSHIKITHAGIPASNKKLKLTTEQEEELDKVTMECFPMIRGPKQQKTCTLCQVTVLDNRVDQYYMKHHALSHIDIMLYKCKQSRCQYVSKYYNDMVRHGRKKHKIESMPKEDIVIELTDDQKKEIEDMFKKCFPEEEDGIDD